MNGYLRRLIVAAHDLAELDARATALRSQVDWYACTELYDDGVDQLTCYRQNPDDIFPLDDCEPRCASCEANYEILKRIKVAKRGRLLAMKRIIRNARHVAVIEACV